MNLCWKKCLCFWFVIVFLPRSKWFWIPLLQSLPAVIWEAEKRSVIVSSFPLLLVMKWRDRMPQSSVFECWLSSQFFHSPLSPLSRGSLVTLHFMPLEWYQLHISHQSRLQPIIHPAWHLTWCTLHRSYISRLTICRLVILLSQFWTIPLFHVLF